jgi:hypothetical protein
LIKLTAEGGKLTAKDVYDKKSQRTMDDREGGVILVDGRVYGHAHSTGWVCQEYSTGKLLWRERNELAAGSITAADGSLYCFSEEYGVEEGTVVLIEASKDKWIEKGRFALPEESSLRNKPTHKNGRRWTPPVIADGKLYLRDQELIFCYAVK